MVLVTPEPGILSFAERRCSLVAPRTLSESDPQSDNAKEAA